MRERKTVRVNYSLLLWTIIVLILAAVMIFFAHARNQSKSIAGLEFQIDQLMEAGRYKEAYPLINSFMIARPGDSLRRLHQARCSDELAVGFRQVQESIRLNMAALGICQAEARFGDEIPGIRFRLIKRMSEVGNYEGAIDQIVRLVGPETDLDLQKYYTIAKARLWLEGRGVETHPGSLGLVPNWFASLVSMPPVDLLVKSHIEIPDSLDIAGMLVSVCLGDPSKLDGSYLAGDSKESLETRAQGIVERLVSNLPNDPYAWLLRYEISSRDNRFGLSENDIEKAVLLGTSDANVLLVAGKLYLEKAERASGLTNQTLRTGYLQRALELLELSRGLRPDQIETHLSVGDLYGLLGNPEKSLTTWIDAKRVCAERRSLLDFRISNLLIRLNRLPEALEALRSMDQDIESELAYLNRQDQFAFFRQGFECWARYYFANGQYQKATQTLISALTSGKELDAINQASIYSALGDCYRQIGQFDRAASSYEQALLLVPTGLEYRRKAAAAWFSAERFTESYKQLMLIDPKSAIDWIKICDTILELQRQSGQDANYWFTFDKGIAETKRLIVLNPESLRSTWMLEILQLDGNLMRMSDDSRPSGIQTAGEQLWKIVERESFQGESLRAAIVRWKAWGQTDYLARVAQALTSIPESEESSVQNAELLASLGRLDQAKAILGKKIKEQPQREDLKQISLRFDLETMTIDEGIQAIRGMKQGGWFFARRLAWNTLKRPILFTEQEERNPELKAKKVQARLNELKSLEELIKEYEGVEGTEWRYLKARRLLGESSDPSTSNSIELLDLAGYLDRKRPEWPETHLLSALVNQMQGNFSRAIREYNYAIQFGINDLDTYERLVGLLYRQGLLADAQVVLERLGKRAYTSQQLAAVSMQLAGENQQEQLQAAELGTQVRPKDPMAWVWLAQVIELQSRNQPESKRKEEIQRAEAILSKATDVSGGLDLRVLLAKFNLYRATNNDQGQQAILEQVQQSQSIDPAVQWVAVGQIYESLGRLDQATEAYRKASSLGANDLEMRTRISMLYLRENRSQEAIAAFKETVEKYPGDSLTRRRLAILLASRSLDDDWEQVSQLLSPSKESKSPEDIRLQVLLLSQKNDLDNLQKAVVLLERIVEQPGVRTDEDYFQLASLYLRTSRLLEEKPGREVETRQTQEAAGRLLKLVSASAVPRPEYIYTYADYLIRQNRFFDAVEESQKLSAIDASSFPAILLRARIAKLEGDQKGAKSLVLAWVEEKRQIEGAEKDASKLAAHLIQAGQALEIIDERLEGQKLFREAYTLDKRSGVNYVRSIMLTDDIETRNNAVRLLLERLKSEANKESAVLLSLLIRKGETQEELLSAAQQELVQYSLSQKDDRKLIQSMADLWIWRGNESQAIETYRRIIQDRPNDVIALNNLAMLLADSPTNPEESLGLINRAIELVGTKPALMDTKSYVLLRLGRYSEAIGILEVLMAKDSSPSVLFHLYQAYSKNNQTDQAKEIISKLDLAKLQKLPLTPTDQRVLSAITDNSR